MVSSSIIYIVGCIHLSEYTDLDFAWIIKCSGFDSKWITVLELFRL